MCYVDHVVNDTMTFLTYLQLPLHVLCVFTLDVLDLSILYSSAPLASYN